MLMQMRCFCHGGAGLYVHPHAVQKAAARPAGQGRFGGIERVWSGRRSGGQSEGCAAHAPTRFRHVLQLHVLLGAIKVSRTTVGGLAVAQFQGGRFNDRCLPSYSFGWCPIQLRPCP